MNNNLLEVSQLTCVRDNSTLFSDLNFKVEAGSITRIEGPNGSGKTSLLRILTGVAAAESGEVRWFGKPIQSHRAEFGAALTFIGHLPGIKAQLTAEENLAWLVLGSNKAQRVAALAEVGLRGYEDSACYTLSAGQKRRVALARLHLVTTQLWVLDEPFTAIDKFGVTKLEKLLAAHAQLGGAVILTTHHELEIDEAYLHSVSLA